MLTPVAHWRRVVVRLAVAADLVMMALFAIQVQQSFAAGSTAPPAARCRAVHYVLNPTLSPPSALRDIQQAARRVSEVSGLGFVYDGQTGERPTRARSNLQFDGVTSAPLPVLVAWAASNDASIWRGGQFSAYGLATAAAWDEASGTLTGGWVYLNAGIQLPSGFADHASWGGVLMHEFGHLLGLNHAQGRDEMMYPDVTITGPAQWGPLDRFLLREAGERLGCSPRR